MDLKLLLWNSKGLNVDEIRLGAEVAKKVEGWYYLSLGDKVRVYDQQWCL